MEAGLSAVDASTTPEATARAFADAVARRDPEAACAFLSPEGRLLTPDGTEMRGRAQAREFLAQMAVTHRLTGIEVGRVLIAGELALSSQRWTVTSEGLGQEPFEQSLAALLLLIHGNYGWQVLVVAPWGM